MNWLSKFLATIADITDSTALPMRCSLGFIALLPQGLCTLHTRLRTCNQRRGLD